MLFCLNSNLWYNNEYTYCLKEKTTLNFEVLSSVYDVNKYLDMSFINFDAISSFHFIIFFQCLIRCVANDN